MKNLVQSLASYSTVVITGGSSGIGECFIRTIRKSNDSIIICNLSRSEPSNFTSHPHNHHLRTDMGYSVQIREAAGHINHLLQDKHTAGRILLINNAGFGSYGEFKHLDLENELSMIDTNIRGLVQLTGHLLPSLLAHGGFIINVASTAAFQPTPYMATYGATKAFLLKWSLALNTELQPTVRSLALCPGPTESNFFQRAGFKEAPLNGRGQTSQQVVDAAFRAFSRNHSLVVSGLSNKILSAASCRLPTRWQAPLAGKILRKMRLDKFQ